jgi:hypothetical protein
VQADEVWDTLSDADKQRVRLAVRPRDMMTNEEAWAMIRRGFESGSAS